MFGIETFLTWNTLLFGLAVYVVVLAVRKVTEQAVPRVKEKMWWRDIVLSFLPAVLGCFAGLLFVAFPYPEGVSSSSARALFGLVCGFFSAKIYRTVKSVIKSRLPKEEKAHE